MLEGKNRKYTSIFIQVDGKGKVDAENIEHAINVYAEDGATLYSITPKVMDGDTEGYIITFDSTNIF